MKKTNDNEILSIFCSDSVNVKARVTFDECMIGKVHVTYWMENAKDYQQRIDDVFDILFDEVIKNRTGSIM
ncbi:MAG: hypothetical protein NUV47_03420 [Patescibacteria group bacterium]|nr:hypothetical protein [Patescibacteria group bacterium]